MLDFSVSPKRFTNESLIIGGALSTSLAGFRAYALGSTGGVTSRKSTERLAYKAGRGHGHTSKFTLDTTHIQGSQWFPVSTREVPQYQKACPWLDHTPCSTALNDPHITDLQEAHTNLQQH